MSASMPLDRLTALLSAAKGKRILVVGDAMLDVYLIGDVERISPEAPVPVVRIRERRFALGGAANVAQNLFALGAQCDLVAAVGDDHSGTTLRGMLRALGSDDSTLVTAARCTTEKTRVVARSQQVVRVDIEELDDLIGAEQAALLERISQALPQASALVLEDYNKGVLSAELIDSVMEMARDRGIPVVVDPKYRNFFRYRGSTIFKPNLRELEAALGASIDVDHPETLPRLLEQLGVQNILLTMGARGMVLFGAAGEIVRVPTAARTVFDVVGAGDTVTAYLAAMLAAGATAAEAAVIANTAAGIEVGKLGAATVSPEEVLAYVQEEHAPA